MSVVVVVCGVLLAIGGACAVIRAERGPTILDRTVALDVLISTMIAAGALYAAMQRRTDIVPILVALSLVGFVGSVTVARFVSVEPEGEGRVRTPAEVAAEAAERLRLEQAAEAAAHPRPGVPSPEPAKPEPGMSSSPGADPDATGDPMTGEVR